VRDTVEVLRIGDILVEELKERARHHQRIDALSRAVIVTDGLVELKIVRPTR
jgi:hypothetical protein